MPLDSSQKRRLLELLRKQKAAGKEVFGPSDTDPGVGPTIDGSMRNPLDVDWLSAIKNEFSGARDTGGNYKAALDNPLMGAFGPAAAAGSAAAVSRVGAKAVQGLERVATSPIPAKMAHGAEQSLAALLKKTGASKSVSRPIEFVLGKGLDLVNPIGQSGRIGQGAQKAIAMALDNSPKVFGKYAPILKEASKRGALPAAIEVLYQDSEFRSLLQAFGEQ